MSDSVIMPSAVHGAQIYFSSGLRLPIHGRRGDLLLVLVPIGLATIPVQYLMDRTDIVVKGWLSADLAEVEKDPDAIALMDSRYEAATPFTIDEWEESIALMKELLP